MAPGGWTPWEVLAFALFAGTVPWTALCAGNALLGFAILMRAGDPPAVVLPALRRARPGAVPGLATAIAACVRNEDMRAVLPPLGRLLGGLVAVGDAVGFNLWLLSDNGDAPLAAAEGVEV